MYEFINKIFLDNNVHTSIPRSKKLSLRLCKKKKFKNPFSKYMAS